MTLYHIAGWHTRYENNRTRELKKIDWVPVPNKHDGEGYTLLVEKKNGAALFGAWMAIIQVASKCDPRGTLLRDTKKPHDSASIARLTRLPAALIQEALDFFSSDEIQWLQSEEVQAVTNNPVTIPQSAAEIPQETVTEGKGGEGKEEKGMEAQQDAAASPATETDEVWLERLKADPAYIGIDVPREHAKARVWCETNRKVLSRRRFINWLSRAERPMSGGTRKSEFGGAF